MPPRNIDTDWRTAWRPKEARSRLTKRNKQSFDQGNADMREQALAEDSYRRGFFQGFHALLTSIESGDTTLSEAKATLYGELYDWRVSQHNAEFQLPPTVRFNDATS